MTPEEQAQSKRQRARELQRQRRAKKRRIDYYPSEAAAAVIEALCDSGQSRRGRSSVIDALILRQAYVRNGAVRQQPLLTASSGSPHDPYDPKCRGSL